MVRLWALLLLGWQVLSPWDSKLNLYRHIVAFCSKRHNKFRTIAFCKYLGSVSFGLKAETYLRVVACLIRIVISANYILYLISMLPCYLSICNEVCSQCVTELLLRHLQTFEEFVESGSFLHDPCTKFPSISESKLPGGVKIFALVFRKKLCK